MSLRASVGAVLFAAAFAAALLAAIIVVRARDPDLALEVTHLTRKLSPSAESARISFFVRESDSDASVAIVDTDDEPVRTLDDGVDLEEGRTVAYRWDGTTDSGAIAPRGSYYVRVELPSHERDMVWPRRIKVFGASEGE